MKILVINPGSTSTKIAVYENETPLLVRNIKHSVEELSVYPQVIDQFEFRKNLVLQELEANGIPFEFDAVIGRGGLVKPIPGGVYEVNEAMKRDTLHAMRTHACNLGGLIAEELASSLPHCPAYIADPGVVDELEEVARIRLPVCQRGNGRIVARPYLSGGSSFTKRFRIVEILQHRNGLSASSRRLQMQGRI